MFLPFLFSMYIYNCIYLFWNYFVVWSICFLIFLSQCFLPVDLFFDSFSKNTWNLAIQSKIATLKPTNRLFCDAIVTDVAFFWPVTFQIVNGLWHHLPEAVAIVASATGRSNSTSPHSKELFLDLLYWFAWEKNSQILALLQGPGSCFQGLNMTQHTVMSWQ